MVGCNSFSTLIPNALSISAVAYFISFDLQGFPTDCNKVDEVFLKGLSRAKAGVNMSFCRMPYFFLYFKE